MPTLTQEKIADLDRNDPLRSKLSAFLLPEDVVYLDGNSLGPLSRKAKTRVEKLLEEEWGRDLIQSWNTHDWINLPQTVGDKIAPLIGAAKGEVVAADSTSINLFKAVHGALQLNPGRKMILTEKGNFPTDLYILQGIARASNNKLRIKAVEASEIKGALDTKTAVLVLTHVNYKTSEMHRLAELTRKAHEAGALAVWDLSHSAGAVPVDLNRSKADFAVGCGYKYLNGGPGAPGFIFVAKRHQDKIDPILPGWIGHADPFAFSRAYKPAPGILRQVTGTPAIVSLVALDAALDIFDGVDMSVVYAKTKALGDLFLDLVEEKCKGFGFETACPGNAEHRGSQVTIRHREGYAIMQALISRGVIGDFRAPDVVRFGFAPLYTRFQDVWKAVEILREIMETGLWKNKEFQTRARVT